MSLAPLGTHTQPLRTGMPVLERGTRVDMLDKHGGEWVKGTITYSDFARVFVSPDYNPRKNQVTVKYVVLAAFFL